MRWLLKPIMRPIARRKLADLYEHKNLGDRHQPRAQIQVAGL